MDKTNPDYNIITIKEGTSQIQIPQFEKVSSQAPVFYNPKMELNRDISILALQTFQKKENRDLDICDLFGGSGIRAIRYKNEINGIQNVTINDINPTAKKFQKINTKLNNLENINITQNDANIHLRENRGKYDIIDIDPFGTPSPFIDSAGYSIRKNSLLCITATDTSALCGTYHEPCIRKYNAQPYKSEYCHETGIRILAGYTALTLAKYKKHIKILLSHSTQHYMRLYIQIQKGSKKTDQSLQKIGYISHCPHCLYRQTTTGITNNTPQTCPECQNPLKHAGPLWLGKIQNQQFIKKMINETKNKKLNTQKKTTQLLQKCQNEAESQPTFYDIHTLCQTLKTSAPKLDQIIKNIKKQGYTVTKTHFQPLGIKTKMPITKIKKTILQLNP